METDSSVVTNVSHKCKMLYKYRETGWGKGVFRNPVCFVYSFVNLKLL